jgi:hypothetical protein
MGCGSVRFGLPLGMSSGIEASFFFSCAVRPLKMSMGASCPA